MAGPTPVIHNKDSNMRANILPPPTLPRSSGSRRASEPPHLLGAGSFYVRNQDIPPGMSVNDTESDYHDYPKIRRENEDRENSRSISRARLRRDSFGEVVSRRSPSQDSIGVGRGGRTSPMIDRSQYEDANRDRYTPAHDTWSVTGPSSRASPHESPEHQVSVKLFINTKF